MGPLSKISLIKNSDPLIKGQLSSHSQKSTLKSNLFTNQATHLTSLLKTIKNTFGHQVLAVQNTKWMPSAKTALTATGVISTLTAGSYVAYQYFTKTTPPKVSVTPLSLIEPIKMIVKDLSVLGMVALGTKWFISKSNDRYDNHDSFESSEADTDSFDSSAEKLEESYQIEKAFSLIEDSKEQSNETILKSNQKEFSKSIKFFLKKSFPKVASVLMTDYIKGNCIIDEKLIDLVAQTSPNELYLLIMKIVNNKNVFSIQLYNYALLEVFKIIDKQLAILFSDKNNETRQNAYEQTIALLEPLLNNDKLNDIYGKFIYLYPKYGWKFAKECIIDRTPFGKKIVEQARAILFTLDYTEKVYAEIFAIALIQHQLKINKNYCSNIHLQMLFNDLCYKEFLKRTIDKHNNSNLNDDLKKIGNEMIIMALKTHKREGLVLLRNNELKEERKEELKENNPSNLQLQ